MPMYEYECTSCKHRFEVLQKFADKPVKSCPKCKKRVKKLISSSSIQFKGTGWYVTDYARKSSPDTTKSDKDGAAKKESKPTPAKESSSSSKDASSAGASKKS